MAVTNELAFPTTEDQFEEMCFHLYRKEWNDGPLAISDFQWDASKDEYRVSALVMTPRSI